MCMHAQSVVSNFVEHVMDAVDQAFFAKHRETVPQSAAVHKAKRPCARLTRSRKAAPPPVEEVDVRAAQLAACRGDCLFAACSVGFVKRSLIVDMRT